MKNLCFNIKKKRKSFWLTGKEISTVKVLLIKLRLKERSDTVLFLGSWYESFLHLIVLSMLVWYNIIELSLYTILIVFNTIISGSRRWKRTSWFTSKWNTQWTKITYKLNYRVAFHRKYFLAFYIIHASPSCLSVCFLFFGFLPKNSHFVWASQRNCHRQFFNKPDLKA